MHGLVVPSLYCPMCLLSTTEYWGHQSFPALGAEQAIMDYLSYVLNSPIFLSLVLNHGEKLLSNSSPDHISPCIFKCTGHCSPASQEWTVKPWMGNADLLSSRNPVPLGCMSRSACVCPRHWPCLTLTSRPWKDKLCFHEAHSFWTFQSVVSMSHTCGVPVDE